MEFEKHGILPLKIDGRPSRNLAFREILRSLAQTQKVVDASMQEQHADPGLSCFHLPVQIFELMDLERRKVLHLCFWELN